MTDLERENVHAEGHIAPVQVSSGFAVLVPCANSDWEVDVLPTLDRALECGRYYWGASFGA